MFLLGNISLPPTIGFFAKALDAIIAAAPIKLNSTRRFIFFFLFLRIFRTHLDYGISAISDARHPHFRFARIYRCAERSCNPDRRKKDGAARTIEALAAAVARGIRDSPSAEETAGTRPRDYRRRPVGASTQRAACPDLFARGADALRILSNQLLSDRGSRSRSGVVAARGKRRCEPARR